MAYYLGIDGGGSKTACLVGDEIRVLGRGHSSGSNLIRVGEAEARKALHEAVRAACADAGIDPARVTKTVAGVAGVGRPEVRDFVSKALREVVGGEVVVVTDANTALHAAFGAGPGVVVIAGTGSIALAQDGQGKDGQGQTARTGGWGWAISDEGSGPWIGRAAVSAVFRAADAGKATELERRILRVWQLGDRPFSDRQQLVTAANALPQPDFGSLLTEVVAAADAGDTVAAEVFANAGRELASLATLAVSRLFAGAATVRVAMSGGAFAHAPNLRKAFYNGLQAQLPNATLVPDLADPVQGALRMARGR